jgi:protein-L-isoaspartate O-methyltransferase
MESVGVNHGQLNQARLQIVRDQIAGRGISNSALLEAMSKVQREFLVPPHLAEFAYLDTPLPIESGQTISQPYIVALMIEVVAPRPSDRALEIGTGSGYGAAVLSQLVAEVYTVERSGSIHAPSHGSQAPEVRVELMPGAPRARNRRYLPSRIRTHEPLLPGLSASTVRGIRLVR